MGEKRGFLKGGPVVPDRHRQSDAAKLLKRLAIFRGEGEGNETGAEFGDVQSELPRDAIAEVGRAKLGKGQAAGRDNEGGAIQFPGGGGDAEAIRFLNVAHGAAGADFHSGGGALRQQHFDDGPRAAVAELLTQFFLMIGNAVFFHQGDKILRGVTRQGGAAEIGVGREEVVRPGVDIGEIAASAAGDGDFLSGAVIAFEQGDPASALSGGEGAHHARGPAADDDDVELCRRIHRDIFVVGAVVSTAQRSFDRRLTQPPLQFRIHHPAEK